MVWCILNSVICGDFIELSLDFQTGLGSVVAAMARSLCFWSDVRVLSRSSIPVDESSNKACEVIIAKYTEHTENEKADLISLE